jgi:polyisoprenoid-binding protein YceI
MLKKAVIAVIVVAVLAGGTLFVLDRTLFAPAPITQGVPVAPTIAVPTAAASTAAAPTQAPTASAAQATQAPAPADPTQAPVLYRIDATQSEARYEVNETFFQDNRLNTAIGRTKGVAGDILVDFNDPAKSQIGDIVINVSQLTSDEGRRDNFIRNNGLESSRYPEATFKTTAISGLPAQVKTGDVLNFTISGDLTVKQTTRPVTWQVQLTVGDKQLSGTAETAIKMSDFGVGPIRLAILATEDDMKLFFDFVAVAQ